MRRLISVLIVMALICPLAHGAYKDQHTIKGFVASGQIKGISSPEDVKIYKVTFQATANTAFFGIYDSVGTAGESNTTIKIEGSEATSGNGKTIDFSDNPVEFSTGAYLDISNMKVLVEYE